MRINEGDLRGRLGRLSLDEKVALLTGADFWSLRPIEKIGLARLVMSDGPGGVRGTAWDERDTSLLFPSTSALAASWDPELAWQAGRLTGAQARDKGVHVLLAPTVNLHRSPLGGRHFETYSADPMLTARMAAAFVTGVQSAGVGATVKHFVANDSETDRMTYDVRVSGEALRETYLRPFEEAVRAGVWLVMTAYNSVDGATMTENGPLVTGVLKNEWDFDGVVVSDWTAVRSTEASANAGNDLAMPGPMGPWGDKLVAAVREGRVAEELIDDKVLRVLRLAARVGALAGLPGPEPVTTPDDARAQLRRIATRGAVLLRNEGALPLTGVRRLALIGPNAVRFGAQGGGSAHVNPVHVVTPAEGIGRAFDQVSVHSGVYPHRILPDLDMAVARDPDSGEPGLRLEYRNADGELLRSENRRAAKIVSLGNLPADTAEVTARTVVTADEAGEHTFSVTGAGIYRLAVGEHTEEFRLGAEGDDPIGALVRPPEHRYAVGLAAGQEIPVEVRQPLGNDVLLPLLGIGHQGPHLSEDAELAAAVEAARDADAAVVVVGTNDDVESEGFDRATLALPGRQDELVSAIASANPRTVVVVNAGAPVLMPWRDEVAAILWAWLPGQEGGDAIADVLTGASEPGGRLPTPFPAHDADPSLVTPVDGTLDYSREYEPGELAYPFGHGLGFTTWSYEKVTVTSDGSAEVTLRNTGDRAGREVVQCYSGGRLVGFAVVEAAAGEAVTTRVTLDGRSFATWDDGWSVAPGPRELRVGRSAADLPLSAEVHPASSGR